jgi:hypothetical protein
LQSVNLTLRFLTGEQSAIDLCNDSSVENNTPMTDTIKALIPKAKIIDFDEWIHWHSTAVLQIFRDADAEQRYLTNEDLERLLFLEPEAADALSVVRLLRNEVHEIITDARANILTQFPTIAEPGGALYPPIRSESCWRDLWHFLRQISYGIAGGHPQYSSPKGLKYLNLLYQELQVPLDAMVLGLVSLKSTSLIRCPSEKYTELEVYFDHTIDALKQFKFPTQV